MTPAEIIARAIGLSSFTQSSLDDETRQILVERHWPSHVGQARAVLSALDAAGLAVVPKDGDLGGKARVAGRDEFMKYALRFAKADTHQAESAVCDVAPAQIVRSMIAASTGEG